MYNNPWYPGHQPYQPSANVPGSPWLFGDFSTDVNCNNFENPYHHAYQSGLFLGQPQPFYPSGYNAPIPTGNNIRNPMNHERSIRRRQNHNHRNDFKNKNVRSISTRNDSQNKHNTGSRTESQRKDGRNIFVSYGNISDFCMKLSKQTLEGTDWIDKITEHTSSIDKQISLFILGIEADEKFYEKADEMCKKLKQILQPEFPQYEFTLKLFGSSRSHLALKDSDFDIYADFGDGDKPAKLLNRIAKVVKIHKRNLLFQIITSIKARVPIVQCKSYTEPCCDISFKNPLGVFNSSLIRFLISLDERVRPVILILKFWLKKNGLLHFSHVSSYGLANLAIFYFQQGSNPILPSVHFLQEKSPNKEIIEGWNVSFTEDKTDLFSSKNNMSILELFRGFLNFYRDFDFESYAISTFLGKTLPKSQFSSADKLPSELELYKKHLSEDPLSGFMEKNPMWLQDPLIHNFNIARNTISIRDFKRKVNEASVIVNKEWENSKSGNYKCVLFKELFKRVERVHQFIPRNKK